jgi:hypothetical protein
MKKLAMHWKILIGMIVGLLFGLLMKNLEQKGLLLTGLNRRNHLYKPPNDCGSISGFLDSWLADLKDISKLSKLGERYYSIYVLP